MTLPSPIRPQRNRQDIAKNPVQLATDAARTMAFLRADPLRTLMGPAMNAWRCSQKPEWSNGYWRAVCALVIESMRADLPKEADDARAAFLGLLDKLVPSCREYVTGSGPTYGKGIGEGTVVLTDPETGDHMTKINHQAVIGYTRLAAELQGLISAKGSTQVTVQVALGDRLANARARVIDKPAGELEAMLDPSADDGL